MHGGWRQDGPILPIEFARISADGRLTLVLLPGATKQRTYWAHSELATLADARRNLKEREEREQLPTADIHFISRDGRFADGIPADVLTIVTMWLREQRAIDAVIWTGLPSNWTEKRGREFTDADAVAYISELEAARDNAKTRLERAREYVTNAPPFIDTQVRRELRQRGWIDAQLAATLFEHGAELEDKKGDTSGAPSSTEAPAKPSDHRMVSPILDQRDGPLTGGADEAGWFRLHETTSLHKILWCRESQKFQVELQWSQCACVSTRVVTAEHDPRNCQ